MGEYINATSTSHRLQFRNNHRSQRPLLECIGSFKLGYIPTTCKLVLRLSSGKEDLRQHINIRQPIASKYCPSYIHTLHSVPNVVERITSPISLSGYAVQIVEHFVDAQGTFYATIPFRSRHSHCRLGELQKRKREPPLQAHSLHYLALA